MVRVASLALLVVAVGCGDGSDAGVPATGPIADIHGGPDLTLQVTTEVGLPSSGGPWGWVNDVLFFIPKRPYLGVRLTSAEPGKLFADAPLGNTSSLSGEARLEVGRDDVVHCVSSDGARLAVGIQPGSQSRPYAWCPVYIHAGRAVAATSVHAQSCEEVLEGMDPLETWLDERRPRDESCRIAAWLELELDCAEHGAGVPMQ